MKRRKQENFIYKDLDDESVLSYLQNYRKTHSRVMMSCINQVIRKYIENRFKDENKKVGFKESLYRIEHRMTEPAKCIICGKPLRFNNKDGCYKKYCSSKCMISDPVVIEKIKRTNKEKYGTEHPLLNAEIKAKASKTKMDKYGCEVPVSQNPDYIAKRKENNIRKYGCEHPLQNEKIKEKQKRTNKEKYGCGCSLQNKEVDAKARKTCIEKYGHEYALQNEKVQKKARKTCIEKYGHEYALQNDKIKEKKRSTNREKYGCECSLQNKDVDAKARKTCIEKYGHEYALQNDKIKSKLNDSKRKNHSFNTSKIEENVYEKLKEVFGEENVLRQYKSNVYPFACDFYIKNLDLYLELNFHWTHGGHPFNPLNEDDVEQAKLWKSKNTKFYDKAIEVWTQRDPLKIKTAREKHLNYNVFYDGAEFNKWFNFLQENLNK